jgi:cytochrome P450
MCIGFALAQLELTLIAARLAQRCDIAALTAAVPDPVGLIVNRPDGGAVVTIERRAR